MGLFRFQFKASLPVISRYVREIVLNIAGYIRIGKYMFFQFRGLRLAEISTLPRSIVREAHEISKELIKQKEVLNMLKIWAWFFNTLCELAACNVC